jgi:hypothetical protein
VTTHSTATEPATSRADVSFTGFGKVKSPRATVAPYPA